MSVVAEFALPPEDFALARTFEAVPELTVEVERMVADPDDRTMPYLWTTDADPDRVGGALQADPTTTAAVELDRTSGGTLFRVRWADEVRETVRCLLQSDPVVLTGSASARGWEFQLRFERRADLAVLQGGLDGADADAELQRLHPPETPTVDGQFALTAKQREALTAALEAGYFAVPRDATLADLAGDLGISSQALSKRIRRGHEAVCRQVLTLGPGSYADGD